MTPERTPDTMSMAIAMSSPSGRMSKRFNKACTAKLGAALFGTPEEQQAARNAYKPSTKQQIQSLTLQAERMRDYAKRGMKPRKAIKEAKRLEARIRELKQ